MLFKLSRVFVPALLAVALVMTSTAGVTATRKMALGVSMLPYHDLAVFDQFAADVGRAPAIWSIWGDWAGTNSAFPTELVQALHARGTVPMAIWQPVDSENIWTKDYKYKKILQGVHDEYIRAWATAARDSGGTIILRFAHEMDGNWFPWGMRRFGNKPFLFKKAWRHVWNIFKGPDGVGATNVRFLWSPLTPKGYLYPGDEYVDYIGFTKFNGWYPEVSWMTMKKQFEDKTARALAIADKPIIVAETGSGSKGGDKPAWIAKGYSKVYNALPRIKAIVYFNVDMRSVNQPNWSMGDKALIAYRGVLTDERFHGVIR